jgi:single-stranded-DNA-specific exonuclease
LVEELCTRRKEVERAVTAEALAMLDDPALAGLPAIVLAKQGWHPGVVGIVAGRLTSRFGKPTVILALDGARGRGSARAPAGFSVYDALSRVRDTLVGFGGHHAAAGVDVEADRVDTLRERFAQACADMGVPDSTPRWAADALLEEGDDPARVLGDLTRFEPCGQSNPAPRVAAPRARVLGARELRGGHLKAWLEIGGKRVSCFGPEMGDVASKLGSHARVVGALRHDTYTGGGAVELRLLAIEPADAAVGVS